MLPITETHLPIHHSEQHYPVIVKTEDFPRVAGPVVISEERPPVQPQSVAEDNLQHEQQSYEHETAEEAPAQEERVDHDAVVHDQEQRELQSQEEIAGTALYQPGNIEEQTCEEEIQDEQIQQEQFQEEQIQHEQFQDKQIQQELPDAPLPDQERVASERSFPAEDSSVPWMQESAQDNVQQSDEFYTPEEQVIPQSHAYSQEYREESYEDDALVTSDSHEPWVMVDHPSAEEQENYFRPEDSIEETRQVELEMSNEGYVQDEAEEEADYQYYDDEQRMDNEEVDEPRPSEVCTLHC